MTDPGGFSSALTLYSAKVRQGGARMGVGA